MSCDRILQFHWSVLLGRGTDRLVIHNPTRLWFVNWRNWTNLNRFVWIWTGLRLVFSSPESLVIFFACCETCHRRDVSILCDFISWVSKNLFIFLSEGGVAGTTIPNMIPSHYVIVFLFLSLQASHSKDHIWNRHMELFMLFVKINVSVFSEWRIRELPAPNVLIRK